MKYKIPYQRIAVRVKSRNETERVQFVKSFLLTFCDDKKYEEKNTENHLVKIQNSYLNLMYNNKQHINYENEK